MNISRAIARYSMFGPGARAGVAVSGGADSVALLHALAGLDWKLSLTVLHLDHGLRGGESAQDRRFVEDLAARLGLPCLVEAVQLDPLVPNLEELARRARLDFFRRARRDLGLDCVATAHTMSDQAETVLFRLLRGAGTAGLAGILPVTAEGIVRPLIETGRDEVLDYLRAHHLEWREDSSNGDLRFARNRIRHHLLPELAREWNPRIASTLARTAAVAHDEHQYWQMQVSALEGRLTRPHSRGIIVASGAAREEPALLRYLIRHVIARVKGSLTRIEFDHVEGILGMLRGGETNRMSIPELDVVRWRGDVLVAVPFRPYFTKLTVPGSCTRLRVVPEQSGYNEDDRNLLDADRLSDSLLLRNWQPGDAYRPAGHARVQRVKDLFQSASVPSWDRAGWPILISSGKIVWSERFGVSMEAGCAPETRRPVRVIVEKWWDNESKGALAPSQSVGGGTGAWESA